MCPRSHSFIGGRTGIWGPPVCPGFLVIGSSFSFHFWFPWKQIWAPTLLLGEQWWHPAFGMQGETVLHCGLLHSLLGGHTHISGCADLTHPHSPTGLGTLGFIWLHMCHPAAHIPSLGLSILHLWHGGLGIEQVYFCCVMDSFENLLEVPDHQHRAVHMHMYIHTINFTTIFKWLINS